MQCTVRLRLQIVGCLFLLAAVALAAKALGTTYWIVIIYDQDQVNASAPISEYRGHRLGLFEVCHLTTNSHHCKYRFERHHDPDEMLQYDIWEVACIILTAASILASFGAMIAVACSCARCPFCVASFTLLAVTCSTTSVILYAYCQLMELKPNEVEYFAWSYWSAVASAIMMFAALPLFVAASIIKY